jgi:hypothetical protein
VTFYNYSPPLRLNADGRRLVVTAWHPPLALKRRTSAAQALSARRQARGGVGREDARFRSADVAFRNQDVCPHVLRWPAEASPDARPLSGHLARWRSSDGARRPEPGRQRKRCKQRRNARALLCFKEVVDDFANAHAAQHYRPSHAHEMTRLLRARFVAAWADREIKEISKGEVIKLLDHIAAAGTPSAANHALTAIRKLFNWCLERGLVEANPCANLSRPAPVGSVIGSWTTTKFLRSGLP